MRNYNLIEKILFPKTYIRRERLHREIKGKTILITGASSGIGEQLAITLASLPIPLHLILVARRGEKLAALKDELQSAQVKVDIVRADLRLEDELKQLLQLIHELPNGLDIIVNNAGLSIHRSIYNSLDRMHDFTRTMGINYFAPVQLILSTIPVLQQTKGQIINISTVNALLYPMPKWAAYQASKIAFDTWLKSVAPELKKNGIVSTSIYLPLVKTPMIAPTKAYEKMPAMTAEHVTQIIMKAMYTKKRSYRPWWIFFAEPLSVVGQSLIASYYTLQVKRKGRKDE